MLSVFAFGKYEDFELFTDAQKFSKIGNYKKVEDLYKTLMEEHSDSILLKSNYAKHYIGMNFFYLEEYEEAIRYLKEAVYIPSELKDGGYFKSKRKDYFQYQNEYYIAEAYEKLGEWEEAQLYYEELLKPYFEVDLEEYTKKALEKLKNYNEEYAVLYEVIFDGKLDRATELAENHMIYAGDYLFSKGILGRSEAVYKLYLFTHKDYDVEIKLLENLTRQKKYDDIIYCAENLLKSEKKDMYYFYLGNAYRRKGSFFASIDALSKISGESKVYHEANYIIGRLYMALDNKEEALECFKTANTWTAIELQAKIYYDLGEEDAYEGLKAFIKEREWWNISAEYRYKLYEKTKDKLYLEEIIKHNPNTYYYELAVDILDYKEEKEDYQIDELDSKYKELNELIAYLEDSKDSNLCKIAIDQYEFSKEDSLYKEYLRIKNYIKAEDYYNAMNIAIKHRDVFYSYKNLEKYIYPKYYEDYVEKWSSKYAVDSTLVYSIIRQESQFNRDVISKASAYGLMQLIIPTAKSLNKKVEAEELLDPKINTRYGTMYIGQLLKKYNGRMSTAVAAYNGGPGNLLKWDLDENGDIVIDSITFAETKKYVEKVMNNYYKYKRIYTE